VDQQQQFRWRPSGKQVIWTSVIVAVVTISILIAVIAGGGIWFNRQQRQRELEMAEQRIKQDRKVAQGRAETDRQIADQRRQDDTLQGYLEQMGQLLLDHKLRQYGETVDGDEEEEEEGDEVRTLARARTLTVLGRLDGEHKRSVLQSIALFTQVPKKGVLRSSPVRSSRKFGYWDFRIFTLMRRKVVLQGSFPRS